MKVSAWKRRSFTLVDAGADNSVTKTIPESWIHRERVIFGRFRLFSRVAADLVEQQVFPG